MMNVHGVSSRVARLIFLAAVFVSASAQGVFRVASFDDLRRIGSDPDAYPLSADYELVCDIDASDSRVRPFVPIGGGGSPFTGRFFGRGGVVYVIRNLRVSRPAAGHVGLFGIVGYGAEVSNVGVVADTIAGSFAVGVLAGSNNGRIVNCYGSGVVVAGRRESDAGGLVGVNSGGIYGSYSAASVYGADNVGGLVGLLRISAAGEVRQCFALGAVSGGENVGGLVGQVFGGRVRESFSAGRVSGAGDVGGLIGWDFSTSSTWSDRGVFVVEGVTRYVGAAEVSGSFWDAEASGQRASAGGEGRSGVQMRSRGTFAGWDFDSVWAIAEGVGYPQLARIPYSTRTLVYAVDDEGCGRLRVSAAGGVAEAYRHSAAVMSGSVGPNVAAEAWGGCRFAGWSDGAVGAVREDVALRDAVFTAKFERVGGSGARFYRYAAGDGGGLWVSGVSGPVAGVDTAVAGGGGVVVAAAPGVGYRFAGWSDGFAGVARSDSAPGGIAAEALFVEDGGRFIQVSRYADLYLIGKHDTYPLNGNYELVGDINLRTGGRLDPIGSAGAPFTGVFRGNGYKISGVGMSGGGQGGDFCGLFGYAAGADIRGLFVEGSVSGGDNVGVLVGKCENTVIDSCGSAGSARGRSGVGGLVGRGVGSLISRSYSTASVDGSEEVGGLAGGARGSFVARSYASGAVSGAAYAGGAVGWGAGGQAQDCYAVGGVVGERAVGGFMGAAGGGIGVLRSYSAGLVAGGALGAGGFAGTLGGGGYGAVSIAACYWDTGRSGRGASAGGVGAGAAEMRLKGTYAGWDFAEVWDIGGGYPWLRGLAPDSIPGVFPERRRESAAASVSAKPPLVRVVGRAIYVNARDMEPVRIRLIDMRGKTVARYEVTGAARLSVGAVASGGYIVEASRRGRREGVWPLRVFK